MHERNKIPWGDIKERINSRDNLLLARCKPTQEEQALGSSNFFINKNMEMNKVYKLKVAKVL